MTQVPTSQGLVTLELTVESMRHRIAQVLSEHEAGLTEEIATAVNEAIEASRWRERLRSEAHREVEAIIRQVTQGVVREAFDRSDIRERMIETARAAAEGALGAGVLGADSASAREEGEA